jgi:hypothetical protein
MSIKEARGARQFAGLLPPGWVSHCDFGNRLRVPHDRALKRAICFDRLHHSSALTNAPLPCRIFHRVLTMVFPFGLLAIVPHENFFRARMQLKR